MSEEVKKEEEVIEEVAPISKPTDMSEEKESDAFSFDSAIEELKLNLKKIKLLALKRS